MVVSTVTSTPTQAQAAVQTLHDVLLTTSLAALDAIDHRPVKEAFATINDLSSALVASHS